MPEAERRKSTRAKRGASHSLRRTVLYLVPLTLFLLSGGVALASLHGQRHDGARINLAGRQRMLTQKLAAELLLHDLEKPSGERIRRTMDLFESTLHALTFGGRVEHAEGPSIRSIPPAEDDAARNQLARVLDAWTPFRANVDAYLASGDEPSRRRSVAASQELLMETDKAVALMERAGESRRGQSQAAVGAGMLVLLCWATVGLVLRTFALRKARTRIEELERLLPICANCKRIRIDDDRPEDQASWTPIEAYLQREADLEFTHGICPECAVKLFGFSPSSRS